MRPRGHNKPQSIKNYLLITKPGILFGNIVSISGGYFLAAKGDIDIGLLVSTITGISLIIAAACIFNNCADKNLDRKMTRTRGRAIATGAISPLAAVIYATGLGVGGLVLLWAATNRLTVTMVLAGFTIYVGFYSLYLKRHSVYAPLIGSLAGATPPLAGYCAVSNQFDSGALILLCIFSLWQIPHFYSIAIYRLEDYTAAAIPVLPVKRGVSTAKNHILVYIVAFIIATLLLTLSGYTGYRYFSAAISLGFMWLALAWKGFKTTDNKRWAKKQFGFSIVTIFSLSIMMSVDFVPPSSLQLQANAPQVMESPAPVLPSP